MIRTVITRGYGNGTFNGTIALVVTRGYAIAEPVDVVDTPACLHLTDRVVTALVLSDMSVTTLAFTEAATTELTLTKTTC